MRIIYVHQYFKTPDEGGALRSYYVATALASAGHAVEMVTAHNRPVYTQKTVEGFRVHYLPVKYRNSFGTLRRLYAFIRFVYLAIRLIKGLPHPDFLYITSTPLTTGLIGLKFSKKNIPYVFEVRDLWPEAPFQLGYFKDPLSRKLALLLERMTYRKADILVGLSPGITDHIRSIVPEKDIHLVPNMADCRFFGTDGRQTFPKSPDSETFSIAYTGAIGKVNGLDHLLQCAQAFKEQQLDVQFHIAGEGAMYAPLRRKAEALHLDNIRFYGHLDKYGVRKVLQQCQAVYISFAPLPVLSTNSPNKFFDGLAAGNLCIINVKGWILEEIEAARCGFYADPLDPGQLVLQIRNLLQQPDRILQMQNNARKHALQKFSRKMLTGQIVSILEARYMEKGINKGSVYTLTC